MEERSEGMGGDDWEAAQAVLSYLGEKGVAADDRRDLEDLADVLLDHYAELQDGEVGAAQFVEMLGLALTRRFEARARRYCRRDLLLLDPLIVAEDAIVRVLLETARGVRRKPLAAHADLIVEEASRLCTEDPVAYLFQPVADLSSPDATTFLYLHRACGIVNQLTIPFRRMAWLAWVDGQSLEDIERVTGTPLERIEFFLNRLLEQAREQMVSGDRETRSDLGDDDDDDEEEGGAGDESVV